MTEDRTIRFIWLLAVYLFGVLIGSLITEADAHEATNVQGQPLGWTWPKECCGGTDCAMIPNSAVVERADGYHVTLKAGEHPMLKTKGYSAVIPYGKERPSPSGEYGICLAMEGTHRFCFFAGSRGS